MPDPEQVVEESRTEETQETVVETSEAEKPEPTQESETEHEQEKPARVNGVDKRFAKLTKQKYDLLEINSQQQQRMDRLERRVEELLSGKTPAISQAHASAKEPNVDDFKNEPDPWAAYDRAVARWEANNLFEEKQKQFTEQSLVEQHNANVEAHNKRMDEARSRYKDFDEVIEENDFAMDPQVGKVFLKVKNSGDVAYYLAKHPEEGKKFAAMDPEEAIMELGAISRSLSSQDSPEKRPVTGAPPPVKPVGSSSTRSSVALEDLPQREYNRIRNEQEAKRRFR